MRYGVAAFGIPYRELSVLAATAEACGFDSLWLGEHVLHPTGFASEHPTSDASPKAPGRPVVDAGTHLLDPFSALAALAATTSTIRLHTGVYVVPLRHPLAIATSVATVHEVADGRFGLGVGSGWLREEFDALEADFDHRGRRMAEAVQIIRRAFDGGPFGFQGEHYRFDEVQIVPQRIAVPIILGGNTDVALARAAMLGDGYISSGRSMPLDDALRLRDKLVACRVRSGRTDPFRIWLRIGPHELDDVARYEQEGVEDLVLRADQLFMDPDGVDPAHVEHVAKELISR